MNGHRKAQSRKVENGCGNSELTVTETESLSNCKIDKPELTSRSSMNSDSNSVGSEHRLSEASESSNGDLQGTAHRPRRNVVPKAVSIWMSE